MLRYENLGVIIKIQLQRPEYKDYSIIAISNPIKDDEFKITLYAKEKSIDDLYEICTKHIFSQPKLIKVSICKLIEQMENKNMFDDILNQIEYYIECSGNYADELEKKNLK